MKKTTSHFDGVGLGIDLDRLRRRRDLRVLPVCALVGVVLLLGVLYLLVPRGKEEAPEPLSTKFIKRRPQMTRPLVLRKRPQPVVRPLKREKLVSEVPRAVVDRAGVPGMRGGLRVLESVVAHPKVQLERKAPFHKVQVGPTLEVGEIRIARHAKDHVDLSLEMMDIESLDTGRHRGLVVIDPKDKRKVKGFLHLASVYAESMEEHYVPPYAHHALFPDGQRSTDARALRHLAESMNEYTQIRTDVVDAVSMDSETLLSVPFILIRASGGFGGTTTFALLQSEAENLGRYLVSGGFAYVEMAAGPVYADLPSLRKMVADALGTQGLYQEVHWRFEKLPASHPLYHCFFDFDSLPPSYLDIVYWHWGEPSAELDSHRSPPYLEGVKLDGRLVLVYSLKSYRDMWAGRMDELRSFLGDQAAFRGEERVMQLGVNLLAFALTQEGGIAKRMVTGR